MEGGMEVGMDRWREGGWAGRDGKGGGSEAGRHGWREGGGRGGEMDGWRQREMAALSQTRVESPIYFNAAVSSAPCFRENDCFLKQNPISGGSDGVGGWGMMGLAVQGDLLF